MIPLAIERAVVVCQAVGAVTVAFGEGVGRVVVADGHVVGGAQVDARATVAVLCLPTVHRIALWLGLGLGVSHSTAHSIAMWHKWSSAS